MKFIRTATAAALAVAALFGSFVTASAAPAAETAANCVDNSDPSSFTGVSTKKTFTLPIAQRVLELRYSSTNACAWARFTAGGSYYLWVDRAANISQANAGIWTQLGITPMFPHTVAYTRAFNDSGKVMRACAEVHEIVRTVVCTDWY
ncbi:hypothetical protein GCM10022243_35040 [Saccharothrix violaceirubra]|uniref:DUF2690 domain-containing protein n=1 Tax=Saccharothrix violaceirubra TaxID=413306 RepID=A0A7W7WX06_9PSEU|nr:DUF2690 domain-containing protein [Saccharothrix violaceirubra]MBB4966557.1 hypothetical protein [Saccharothrix violaceirubra]